VILRVAKGRLSALSATAYSVTAIYAPAIFNMHSIAALGGRLVRFFTPRIFLLSYIFGRTQMPMILQPGRLKNAS